MGEVQKIEVPQALPVIVAILAPSGRILGVNEAWKDFGQRNGLRVPDFALSGNYLNYCKSDQPELVAIYRRSEGLARATG